MTRGSPGSPLGGITILDGGFGGASIAPHAPEPLEADGELLSAVLTPEQLADWQTLSTSQREYYDGLPHRMMSRVFSMVSGEVLAEAIRQEVQAEDSNSKPP